MAIETNLDDFNGRLDGILARLPEYLDNTVRIINEEALNKAREYTSNTVPGIKDGDGPRITHLGGWADRTSAMVNSFDHEVVRLGQYTRAGILFNTMIYAVYVEKLGYWVLSGLFEGIMQRIAREHVTNLARFIVKKLK